MRATSRVVALMVAVLVGAIGPVADRGRGQAQPEVAPAVVRSARGGMLARTAHYRFEVFFYTTGVRIFVADANGAAVSASGLTGAATLYHPNAPEPWFARPMHPAPSQPGQPAESLDLAMDLGPVPTSGVTVRLDVAGLPDREEPSARFTMSFAPVAGESGPPHADGAMTPTDSTGAEAVHYFAAAGFYRTTSGALIWVPAPGYYHGTSVQYYPHLPATAWQPAQAATAPRPEVAASRSTGAPDIIQWEPYGRPRSMNDTESYRRWLQGEMWRQHQAGRSPATAHGNCAKCHGS